MTTGSDALDVATERLKSAIRQLDHAVDLRREREAVMHGAEAEIQRMTADRGKLARELDSALARGARLENANKQVSQRLVDAMERVRGVLERSK